MKSSSIALGTQYANLCRHSTNIYVQQARQGLKNVIIYLESEYQNGQSTRFQSGALSRLI